MDINDVKLINTSVHVDFRGKFFEVSRDTMYPSVQSNVSVTAKNVFRGLHYQLKKPQAKLVTVLSGSIIDVVVDLRKDSESFKVAKTFYIEAGIKQLYVPEGFAHGFRALEDNVIVMYGCGDYYNPGDEYGVYALDPYIQDQMEMWISGARIPPNILMTPRDHRFPLLKDIPDEHLF